MRKADGLSFILIDFYVPALTQRLNCIETSLQLSENMALFAVCRVYTYRCHQQRDPDRHQVLGAYHLYIDSTMWGTGQNLVASLLVYPFAYTFLLRQRL
jgi:hypothetical protein